MKDKAQSWGGGGGGGGGWKSLYISYKLFLWSLIASTWIHFAEQFFETIAGNFSIFLLQMFHQKQLPHKSFISMKHS